MKWKDLILYDNVTHYRISEFGHVYSLRKKRLLKEKVNSIIYPYRYQVLEVYPGVFKTCYVARLVHIAFIGPIPEGYEVDHLDMDKGNNHYTNLEAVTRSENMRRARDMRHWDSGRGPGFKHSSDTKRRMSEAKHKPIAIILEGITIACPGSIEEATQYLDTYRKKVYRALQSGLPTRFKANTYTIRYN
jgi:hypothetical protein